MKKISRRIFLIALIAAFLQSCIPSIHPLYTDDTLVFRQDLVGLFSDVNETWSEEGSEWVFKQSKDGKGYDLTVKDGEATKQFDVHMVKLGQHYFLDFFSSSKETHESAIFALAPNFPAHTFAKIIFTDKGFELRQFNPDWLEKLFKEKKIRLKHEVNSEGTVILTAPSRDLQKFVAKYADNEEALEFVSIFEKQ